MFDLDFNYIKKNKNMTIIFMPFVTFSLKGR